MRLGNLIKIFKTLEIYIEEELSGVVQYPREVTHSSDSARGFSRDFIMGSGIYSKKINKDAVLSPFTRVYIEYLKGLEIIK